MLSELAGAVVAVFVFHLCNRGLCPLKRGQHIDPIPSNNVGPARSRQAGVTSVMLLWLY